MKNNYKEKTLRIISVATLIVVALLLNGNVFARPSGEEGKFVIHNQTEENTVVGFYTNDGDGWSDNWLSGQLGPNQTASAQFADDTGACDQILQVGWLGEDGSEVLDDPISIDICKTSNVYVSDNEISYD